jgi:phosphoadenosine phosphosulfate reductase
MSLVSLENLNFHQHIETFSAKVDSFLDDSKSVVVSSSFQTQSLPLLHMISKLDTKIPVAFIDTGFLFPETYIFRDRVAEELKLDIINVSSNVEYRQQIDSSNRFLFSTAPEKCCNLNKVTSFNSFLKDFDVWISGVRADQSATRSKMKETQKNSDGLLRYHPMLNWSSKDIFLYRKHYGLPSHPLEEQGYLSVGCIPCTQKYIDSIGSERGGRWSGLKKDECGLHTDLAK